MTFQCWSSPLSTSLWSRRTRARFADMISGAWTKFRLKTEGWFVLRLRQDGQHQIEFPE